MEQFLQDILTQHPFIFKALIQFIKFFLPIAVSYALGKYTSNNPRHKTINQEQLEKVYLPLYKLLFVQDTSSLERQNLLKLSNRMQNILFKNYELAFPQLHKLSADFHQALISGQNYQTLFNQIKYQVAIDYESLKIKLGYPHINTYEIFKRKTLIDKMRTIWGYLFLLYLFPGIIVTTSFPFSWYLFLRYWIGFLLITYVGVKLGRQRI